MATLVPVLAPAPAHAAGVPRAFETQRPAWHRCDTSLPATFQCATIKVPLDYSRPDGKTLRLAISRIRTSDPAKRRGALVFNPGGPGGEGLDMPALMKPMLPKDVRDRYDLVGFDPRGVGRSSPLTCGLTTTERNTEHPYHPATFDKDVTWARTVAEKCRAKNGATLPYITTRNTARDMDVLRAVVGAKKLSYLGYSYGTYLGAVYAQMFPARTDRFVLDSAVDPARVWRGMIQVWAEGTEPAFARWAEWTARHDHDYKLGDTPAKVKKAFWDLVALADRHPVDDGTGTRLTGDDIRSLLRPQFFTPKEAARTVADLKKSAAGHPVAHPSAAPHDGRPAPGAFARAAQPPADNDSAVLWSVICGDTAAWPHDPEQYRRDAIRDKARYPLYGDFGSAITPCAFWGKPAEPVTKVDSRVGLLTVQNQWDPQTPLTSGLGMHRALRGSRMVYVEGGEGHGVYAGNPRLCADRTVDSYLATGKLPAHDVTCKAAPGTNSRAGQGDAPVAPHSAGAPRF
ncbi:alpha/beta hydrolase [Streptomyces sp. NPDC048664]|uniref:alpha/beta hydrolase n=1 Tax=Streptomyces sp. NPDC048664 TaxID=3154505 RepID=UPI00341E21F9